MNAYWKSYWKWQLIILVPLGLVLLFLKLMGAAQ